MSPWLTGQVALVTGGGSGLGRAIARRFVAEGALVTVVDRDAAAAEAVAAEHPDQVLAATADVRDPDQVMAAIDATIDRFGRLDTLVPNAGIWDYQRAITRLDGHQLAAVFDEVMGINVKGYLLAVNAAWPHLVRAGGSVVMTLSNASFHAAGGGPVYTASKHAGLGLVRELAYELAPRVRVNGVACGGMRTALKGPETLAMGERSIADSFAKADEAGVKPLVPLHEASVEPEDFTGAYVYLASPANSGTVTGAVIPADGGIASRGFRSPAGGDDLLTRVTEPDT